MRTDQLDTTECKTVTKPIGVGRSVVQQTASLLTQPRFIEEGFDRPDFAAVGGRRVGRQRRSVAIDQEHEACAVAFVRTADPVTLLFARENEPSPMDSCRPIRLNRLSLLKSRFEAAWKISLRVRSRCRLQQVAGEGYRSGKSFRRLPEVRIQRIPSRQARDDTRGRPPNEASDRNAGGAVLDPVQFDRRRGGHRNRVIIMSVSPFTDPGMQLACQLFGKQTGFETSSWLLT
jgi:hypothetical protein